MTEKKLKKKDIEKKNLFHQFTKNFDINSIEIIKGENAELNYCYEVWKWEFNNDKFEKKSAKKIGEKYFRFLSKINQKTVNKIK